MPKPKTCSICCLAMLAGIPFNDVIEKIFGKTKPKRLSMSFPEMEHAFHKLGMNTNILKSFPSSPSFDMLCQCRSKSCGFYHYIVYDKEKSEFLDPMPKQWPLEDLKISKCIEIVK